MDTKMVAIIGIIAIAALALGFMVWPKGPVTPSVTTTRPPTTTLPPDAVTPEEESLLIDQINSLTQEELDAISTDMTDFSDMTEDEIAEYDSMFLYQ